MVADSRIIEHEVASELHHIRGPVRVGGPQVLQQLDFSSRLLAVGAAGFDDFDGHVFFGLVVQRFHHYAKSARSNLLLQLVPKRLSSRREKQTRVRKQIFFSARTNDMTAWLTLAAFPPRANATAKEVMLRNNSY